MKIKILYHVYLIVAYQQTKFIKNEYTFCFSNFLMIGLCNATANCWFSETTSELSSVPLCVVPGYLSKNGKLLKKSTLISIIFWISSNTKFFIT